MIVLGVLVETTQKTFAPSLLGAVKLRHTRQAPGRTHALLVEYRRRLLCGGNMPVAMTLV